MLLAGCSWHCAVLTPSTTLPLRPASQPPAAEAVTCMPAQLNALPGNAWRLLHALGDALNSNSWLVNGGNIGFACQVCAFLCCQLMMCCHRAPTHPLTVLLCLPPPLVQHAYPNSLLKGSSAKVGLAWHCWVKRPCSAAISRRCHRHCCLCAAHSIAHCSSCCTSWLRPLCAQGMPALLKGGDAALVHALTALGVFCSFVRVWKDPDVRACCCVWQAGLGGARPGHAGLLRRRLWCLRSTPSTMNGTGGGGCLLGRGLAAQVPAGPQPPGAAGVAHSPRHPEGACARGELPSGDSHELASVEDEG